MFNWKIGLCGVLLCGQLSAQQEWQPQKWPVLKHYDQQHLYRIALPLGGIGTGTVSLGGRGELRDWEIMNVPGKGYSTVTPGNNAPFFCIYTHPKGGAARTTLLAGSLYPQEYQHYEGRPVDHHGLPRFRNSSFDAAYPFGQVHLTDESLPVRVTVKGFNPLVPGDADASGIPIAVLSYEVTNTGVVPVDVSVCGSIRNFIGKDGSRYVTNWKGDYVPVGCKGNRNSYREGQGLKGIYFYSEGVDKADPAFGNMALTTQAGEGVSYRTSSKADDWNNGIVGFWDDFSADGELTEMEKSYDEDPMASLAGRVRNVYLFPDLELSQPQSLVSDGSRQLLQRAISGCVANGVSGGAAACGTGEVDPLVCQLTAGLLLSGCGEGGRIVQFVNIAFADCIPPARRASHGLGGGDGPLRLLSGLMHACVELRDGYSFLVWRTGAVDA